MHEEEGWAGGEGVFQGSRLLGAVRAFARHGFVACLSVRVLTSPSDLWKYPRSQDQMQSFTNSKIGRQNLTIVIQNGI